MKILVYSDGKTAAAKALHFAAHLKKKLRAQLAVITVRSGTHAAEEPPPVGIDIVPAEQPNLPVGIKILTDAAVKLSEEGLLAEAKSITIRETVKGHMFVCRGRDGDRIPFYESFGHFIGALNREIDEHGYDLLIISPPVRSRLGRLVIGDTPRKLALDLHASVLLVREAGPTDRYLICADGSPASHRQFPMLRWLLPAVGPPVDLICVKTEDWNEQAVATARACLDRAATWLGHCSKKGRIGIVEGRRRADAILSAAGNRTVIMLGASLRHDVYKRTRGSLPLQILDRAASSVLLVKLPPESDADFLKMPFTCEE